MGKIVGLTFEAPAPKFICPVCGKEYKRETDLTKHMEKEHPANPPANSPDPENGGGGA